MSTNNFAPRATACGFCVGRTRVAEGIADAVGEGDNVGAVVPVGKSTAICFAGVAVASTVGDSLGIIFVAVAVAVAVVVTAAVIVATDVWVETGVCVSTTTEGVIEGSCGEPHAALNIKIPKIMQVLKK